MIKFRHSATIEQYLSNQMTSLEKEAFERELLNNVELSEEFDLSASINKALANDEQIDLRSKLIHVIAEGRKPKPEVHTVYISRKKWWYAAASLFLLTALSSTLYFSTMRGPSAEKLFNKYYNAEDIIDVTRSSNTSIVEAVMKFQQKDYALAGRLFSQILENDENNMAVRFYYGISCIETENYQKAEESFQNIIDNENNLYVEHAQWYLGLTYLKNNELKKATDQFKAIANDSENFHRQNALHILDQLQTK